MGRPLPEGAEPPGGVAGAVGTHDAGRCQVHDDDGLEGLRRVEQAVHRRERLTSGVHRRGVGSHILRGMADAGGELVDQVTDLVHAGILAHQNEQVFAPVVAVRWACCRRDATGAGCVAARPGSVDVLTRYANRYVTNERMHGPAVPLVSRSVTSRLCDRQRQPG